MACLRWTWLNNQQLIELFGSTWIGEATLKVEDPSDLNLVNLNFANGETFFNFSCNEDSGSH